MGCPWLEETMGGSYYGALSMRVSLQRSDKYSRNFSGMDISRMPDLDLTQREVENLATACNVSGSHLEAGYWQ